MTTEERKIQLGVGVDASGATQGFDQVKQGARDMAQSVAQAGQTASKGLDSVAGGATRAADGFNREEGRMRASMQRVTLDLQTLGKTASEKFEAKINFQGLDPAKFAPYLAALKQAEAAQIGVGTAGKHAGLAIAEGAALSTQQMQGLIHSARGVVDMIAAGQSPMRALVIEGGRLSGTFGGVGNAVSAVSSLITPMRVAFIGAAAAVGGLALALAHAESAARGLASLQAQLAGTGRSDAFSDSGLSDFLKELALAPGVSREAATSIVSELSKVHEIGGGLFKDLARSAAAYAKATGTDVPTAAKTLAQAFSDPEKGAKQLDSALGKLTSTQILAIESLSKKGDFAGAQLALLAALESALKGVVDRGTTPLQESFSKLGNAWEEALHRLDQSTGLRTLNDLLAKTVAAVTFLIENADKVGGLGNVGLSAAPVAGLPLLTGPKTVVSLGKAAFNAVTGGTSQPANPVSSGKIGGQESAPAASAANGSPAPDGKLTDDDIKRGLKAADGYKSQARELADLRVEREKFNKLLNSVPKNSEQGQRFRDAVAGVDEKIASVNKRGGSNEAAQVALAQAQADEKQIQDLLERRKDAFAYSEQFLQGAYQAGEISLKDFLDKQRENTAAGFDAQIATLEEKKARFAKLLADPAFKDPSQRVKVQGDIANLSEEEARLRQQAAQAVELANQRDGASFKQLSQEVLNYRANLLQLQGDEEGAAKIRAQLAIQQAQLQAKKAAGSGTPVSAEDQDATARAITQTNEITAARNKLGAQNQLLQLDEQRLAFLQSSGAIGEFEQLSRLGAARAARLAGLEKELATLEALSKDRPEDLQLKVDVEGFRLQVDQLKRELDPLRDKFEGIFKDAGSTLFEDLMNGTKPKDALKNFFGSIGKQINQSVGQQLSAQLFTKGGPLGEAGGFFADLFGGKDRNKTAAPTAESTAVDRSFASLRTSGIDPTTSALNRLQGAADGAAGSIGRAASPGFTTQPPVADGSGATGDFARFDRQLPSGEQAVMDQFRDAGKSSEALRASNVAAASSVLSMASAASKGGGALSLLPRIISAIQASFASSSGGGGGGLFSAIGGGYGLGGTGFGASLLATDSVAGGSSFADALAAGIIPLSSGGYTGNKDPAKVAGVVHGNEYVFSAQAVKAIGVDRLERMHKNAKSGHMGDGEVPGYADGGYVQVLGSPRSQTMQRSPTQYLMVAPKTDPAPAASGGNHNTIHVSVAMPQGGSRQTAMQFGAEAGRQIQHAMRRNGK